jgi:hypothetical protein
MASETSNKARVGEAFDLLASGLEPYVAQHMSRTVRKGEDWADVFAKSAQPPIREYSTSDPSFLLRVMIDCWRGVFERQLPRSIRNLLFTLRDKRNEWAHNRAIQPHDAQFTLSGIAMLFDAIGVDETGPLRQRLYSLSGPLREGRSHERTASFDNPEHSETVELPANSRRQGQGRSTPAPDGAARRELPAQPAVDASLAGVSRIRIHELAKELGMTNKQTLELALDLGIRVLTHSSAIERTQADRIRSRAEADGLTRKAAVSD